MAMIGLADNESQVEMIESENYLTRALAHDAKLKI